MAFFKSLGLAASAPVIEGNGVFMRVPRMADFEEWAALRGGSHDFLAPWEPVWPDDDLTRGSFRRRIRRYERDLHEESGYAFLVFRKSDRVMLGGATLTNLRRGAAQAASLGYWMAERHAGKGYMSAAIAALVPFTHSALRIRRIEAACLQSNTASMRLLEKLNFTREGTARQYLSIAGSWQDHLLYARLASDPLPAVGAPKD
ncbi:MAG: GNAT family N-acetyltransferase [Rhizobiales bacterium]|nr:GNAT family N-acetyltransferase [Hyphomicrobiales bacterium]